MDPSIVFSSQYFGSTILFSFLKNNKDVYIEAFENYQKRSFRNRCYLLGPNGPQTLSIPLKKGKNAQTPIQSVQISYESNWVKEHLETIRSGYNRSPFLEYYIQEIEEILEAKHQYLFDLNSQTMQWISKKLFLNKPIAFTEDYNNSFSLDLRSVKSEAFRLAETDLAKNMHYAQVFEDKFGFRYCRSILDLLFCCGPEATRHL